MASLRLLGVSLLISLLVTVGVLEDVVKFVPSLIGVDAGIIYVIRRYVVVGRRR